VRSRDKARVSRDARAAAAPGGKLPGGRDWTSAAESSCSWKGKASKPEEAWLNVEIPNIRRSCCSPSVFTVDGGSAVTGLGGTEDREIDLNDC